MASVGKTDAEGADSLIFLQTWAVVCVLIGVLYVVVTAELLLERAFYSSIDAFILIIYTLLAFVPFLVFIYPGVKNRKRSVFWTAAVIEIVVLGLFVLNITGFLGD